MKYQVYSIVKDIDDRSKDSPRAIMILTPARGNSTDVFTIVASTFAPCSPGSTFCTVERDIFIEESDNLDELIPKYYLEFL